MTTLTPVLWIDGRKSKVLKPIVREGKPVHFSPSFQATRYGIKVEADVLPNGLNTRFSVGSEDNEGIAIATTPDPEDRTKVRGSVPVEVASKKMDASVMVHALPDGSFTLKATVTNDNKKTFSESEIFA